MTLRDSQIIKGVAILMMLFLHLFNTQPDTFGYEPLVRIAGQPLAHLLTRAANPVPFFLILSGYGLSYTHHRKGSSLHHQLHRILRLFILFWLVLAVFVPLVLFFRPDRFSLDTRSLWLNVTCLDPSYNRTLWFLFPYALLSLSAGFVCRAYRRMGGRCLLSVTFVLYLLAAYFLSRYADGLLARVPALNQVMLYFYLLFPFTMGVAFERRVAGGGGLKLPRLPFGPWWAVAGIVAFVILRCVFNHSFLNPLYALPVILLFLQTDRPRWLDALLAHLGHYSLMMWMCHKFLFEDLMTDFIYGFRWPLPIFLILLVLSWGCAVPLQKAGNFLADLIPALRKRTS